MGYDLVRLGLGDMTRLGARLRACGDGAASMEDAARRVVRVLRDELTDGPGGRPAAVLARVYRTLRFDRLDDELRDFARRGAHADRLEPGTRCLTLLATAGDRPEWDDRRRSEGHRTIPLPGEEAVLAAPMIAHLVRQLGIDVGVVVRPDPALVLELEQRAYNVFFVPDARGSPYIPAQAGFVEPCGVRSVLGFGGLLPDGDMFAVLLFTRTVVPRSVADLFRNAALNVKVALLPFAPGPVLDPAGSPAP